ncbi:unnamed protein product [Nezara viridula]|uniref:Uncharacterized protein n=1 Tax=Nezara viridula TaxID=85310 RepID=A0A9P0MV55_NEZVI|nr:unnamed protein product [Nezara viridula]
MTSYINRAPMMLKDNRSMYKLKLTLILQHICVELQHTVKLGVSNVYALMRLDILTKYKFTTFQNNV